MIDRSPRLEQRLLGQILGGANLTGQLGAQSDQARPMSDKSFLEYPIHSSHISPR